MILDRNSVINDLNVAKLILCNPQMLTPEMCIRIGQAITSAIELLKEQERIIKLYEKAEPFLYAHGWDWTQVEGWVKQE